MNPYSRPRTFVELPVETPDNDSEYLNHKLAPMKWGNLLVEAALTQYNEADLDSRLDEGRLSLYVSFLPVKLDKTDRRGLIMLAGGVEIQNNTAKVFSLGANCTTYQDVFFKRETPDELFRPVSCRDREHTYEFPVDMQMHLSPDILRVLYNFHLTAAITADWLEAPDDQGRCVPYVRIV